MNIVMLTNTYRPHIGSVARSVDAFARQYRKLGHEVLVVAPELNDTLPNESNVVRIPALQNFNGSDFSVVLPLSGLLTDTLDAFRPDIVHAHHPFLLGMTALRIARFRALPLAFTHHSLYELYTHYVPGDSPTLKQFAIQLATRYANLADTVFAPSESIATLLRARGVRSPISIVPTGVELELFNLGNGRRFRRQMDIPENAFVVGHLGRLAPEKNLAFLAKSVARFIGKGEPKDHRPIHFLVAGTGPSRREIRTIFAKAELTERLHFAGTLKCQHLADAYQAMDVFAFASKSDTQGIVLTEAMAAGKPVVALDAPGTREVVDDKVNGRLLYKESTTAFAAALRWVAEQPPTNRVALTHYASNTAKEFSMPRTATLALECYASLRGRAAAAHHEEDVTWAQLLHLIKAEWDTLEGVAGAASASLTA